MANFDEGGVFYSDQQFVSTGAVHDEAPTLTPQQAIVKFGEFLRTFQVDNKSSVFPYSDQLSRNTGLLRVDLAHLSHPVYGIPDLAAALVENANEHLPLFEQAAALEARRIQALEADGQEPTPKEVQILLFKSGRAGAGLSMRDVKPELYVSKLVIVPCIVTAASRPSHKATHVSIQCRSCRHTLRLPCRPGMGGVALPRKCQGSEAGPSLGVAANQCGLDPYAILSDRVECQDQQNLKLQERPEDVPAGDLPRSMLGVVERALVGCLTPGTRVTAVGILSIFAQKEGAGGAGGREAVAVRQPYLRIVGFQEDVLRGDGSRVPTFSAEEEANFREFAASPLCQQRLFEAMAPAIYGHEDIKKALACLLFGGARKKLPDGTRRRGDVNVLLLGDPSTAKSQFLKFVSRAAPVAVYTSGKGSSAAGLTASVIRDARSREFYLEGGAMVLADGGVVCIDEFDKMRVEDRVAIHEAMEQQTISIAKAGITTMLRSRTAVLAAANPPSGRYDDLASAQENVDLQSTILSRFDLIFIVRDERSAARDAAIARHVLDVHRRAAEGGAREEADELDAAAGAAGLSAEGDAGAGEVAFFKRYVEYARAHCSPRVTESASRLLASEYVEIRAEAQRAAAAGGADVPAVPITVRQLEALVRLSESLARMTLSSEAGESHVRQALELFKVSTMDAVRAGVVDAVVFTEGQRAELRRVEEQVRRRVAIGSHVAERKLVEDLARVGFAESLVRKALLFMQGAGEMEYRRERRLVHRVK